MKATNQSKKLYWVLGDTKRGFKIVDKMPRGKFVPEPFDNMKNAQKWIALQFLLNA